MPPNNNPEFLSLVTSHQRNLYAFVLSLMHNQHDTDEVLQQTNLVVWEKAAEFEIGTDFMAWAGRIAFLQSLAYRQQQKRQRWVFDDELLSMLASEAVEHLADLDDRRSALRKCLGELKPSQRALVTKRYDGPTAVKDLAEELSKTPAAVSESLRRIREKLGACISHRMATEGEG